MTQQNTMTKPYPYVVAIVQARMGASRFPGKMLAPLAGKPVLGWVIDRLREAQAVHQIVVATPDEELHDSAYKNGVWGYLDRGDPQNVLARYIKAGNFAGADIIVRITGDCPLLDPVLVDNCVNAYNESRVDIATNVFRRTYPKGMDVEVFHNSFIKRIFHLTPDPRYREHVTLYAYENPAMFAFKQIFDSEDNSYINVSIDRPSDLDRVSKFILNRKGVYDFGYKEVVRYFRDGAVDLPASSRNGGTPGYDPASYGSSAGGASP